MSRVHISAAVTTAVASIAAALVAIPAPHAAAASPKTPRPAASGSNWLGEINRYRIASGLAPVTDQPAWDTGILHHLTYMEKTPGSYLTGQYQSLHIENPQSPYYTPDGATEGARSNLLPMGTGDPVGDIDGWLTAPFHAAAILDPALTQVAFADDGLTAGLDVGGGLTGSPSTSPVLFPGPGITTDLAQFQGESPSPLDTCGWQSTDASPFPNVGLPLFIRLPQAPSQQLSASLVGDNGQNETTGNGGLCIVDRYTYVSSDPVYGPTGADILQGENLVVLIPQAPLAHGRYDVRVSQPGQPDIAWSFSSSAQHLETRLAGNDRVGTSIAVADAAYGPRGTGANVAVLSRDDSFADALAGNALAAQKGGPLLLTGSGTLDPRVAGELRHILKPGSTVYVLGGTGALSTRVEAGVAALGLVPKRLAGPDRFATAVRVAAEISPHPHSVLLATGVNFPDALTAGAAAAGNPDGGVVLLSDDTTLPDATRTYLAGVNPATTAVYGVGGQAVTALRGVPGIAGHFTALEGADRFATAAAVAGNRALFPHLTTAGLATGQNWPDALSGGAFMGAYHAPLLLLNPKSVPSPITAWLSTHGSQLDSLTIFGGPAAVSDQDLDTAGFAAWGQNF